MSFDLSFRLCILAFLHSCILAFCPDSSRAVCLLAYDAPAPRSARPPRASGPTPRASDPLVRAVTSSLLASRPPPSRRAGQNGSKVFLPMHKLKMLSVKPRRRAARRRSHGRSGTVSTFAERRGGPQLRRERSAKARVGGLKAWRLTLWLVHRDRPSRGRQLTQIREMTR
jgi:hypothetical protein